MELDLKTMLNHTAYVAAPSGYSDGDYSYGSATAYSAYIEEVDGEVVGRDGERIKTTHFLVFDAADVTITLDQLLWFSGADQTDETEGRRAMSVRLFVDEEGTAHHYEVLV